MDGCPAMLSIVSVSAAFRSSRRPTAVGLDQTLRNLRAWRGGDAVEGRAHAPIHAPIDQRHEGRVIPADSQHPRHSAVACLAQDPEQDGRVADEKPLGADVFETAGWCGLSGGINDCCLGEATGAG